MTGLGLRLTTFVGAAATGIAAGWWLARSHDRAHRTQLFSRSPWRRFAALGYIENEGTPESLALVQDYLAWEPQPALRARARRVAAVLKAGMR